jgi:hypothetical protein
MFDPDKHAHLFRPTIFAGGAETIFKAPNPEGEMAEKLHTFMDDADPEVLHRLLGHMYPTATSFIN